MKRSSKNPTNYRRSGEVSKDLTVEQLAGIGKVAISYNEAELLIHLIFNSCLGLEKYLFDQVSTRINGTDGLIEIIAISLGDINCPNDIYKIIQQTLGDGEFKLLKKYRDSIVHARVKDAPEGIGISPSRRGKSTEILLTPTALDGVYQRLDVIRRELACILKIAIILATDAKANKFIFVPEPNKEELIKSGRERSENEIRKTWSVCEQYRAKRLALPELPAFHDQD